MPWFPLFPIAGDDGHKVIKTNTIKYRGNSYSLPFGTYKNDQTKVFLTEKDNRLLIKDQSGLLITTHLIPAGTGNNVVNNNHRRNTSIKLDELRCKVKDFFMHSPDIEIFVENINRLYPRYVRDQLSLVLASAEKSDLEMAEIALEFCVRNSLFSANDFKSILENQGTDKKCSTPKNHIKPLGDAKTQLIVNMEPEKSDITRYESIFNQNIYLNESAHTSN